MLNPEVNLTSHLYAIQTSPQKYWQQLTELLIENEWSVKQTEAITKNVIENGLHGLYPELLCANEQDDSEPMVYFMQCMEFIKIGKAQFPHIRLQQLQAGNPFPITILLTISIYNVTPESERDAKKKRLAKILSVSERTVREWTSRIDKDAKEARSKRIFDLWMQCYSTDEIAEQTGTPRQTVNDAICPNLEGLPKSDKSAAEHATDFEPPIYNVWKQKEKTAGSSHFGNSEVKWLDNLLYLYTNPFDIVVDPFAGGGSTIDLCKKRFRRYWVSDRKPIVNFGARRWEARNRWRVLRLIVHFWSNRQDFHFDQNHLKIA